MYAMCTCLSRLNFCPYIDINKPPLIDFIQGEKRLPRPSLLHFLGLHPRLDLRCLDWRERNWCPIHSSPPVRALVRKLCYTLAAAASSGRARAPSQSTSTTGISTTSAARTAASVPFRGREGCGFISEDVARDVGGRSVRRPTPRPPPFRSGTGSECSRAATTTEASWELIVALNASNVSPSPASVTIHPLHPPTGVQRALARR